MSVRIIKFGKQKYATGAYWQNLSTTTKPRREIIRIGREHDTDMVCVPSVKNPIQAGFFTKEELSGCMTARSLAGALVETHTGSWLGYFKIPDSEEYYYIAIQHDHILANSDIVGSLDEIKTDFEQMLSASGWQYVVVPEGVNYPGTTVKHLTLADMLTKSRAPKIRPLEFKIEDMPTRKILYGTGLILSILLAWYAYTTWQEKIIQEEEARRLQELEIARKLKEQAFITPWINAVPVDIFLNTCAAQWHHTKLSISGWVMQDWSCDGQQAVANYNKNSVASAVKLIQNTPNVTFTTDGQQAAIVVPMTITARGSQPAAQGLTAKATLIDYADRHIQKITFTPNTLQQALPGNAAPSLQPAWMLEKVSLESSYPGFDLLALAKVPGLIIKRISTAKENSEWSWRIEGEFYGYK